MTISVTQVQQLLTFLVSLIFSFSLQILYYGKTKLCILLCDLGLSCSNLSKSLFPHLLNGGNKTSPVSSVASSKRIPTIHYHMSWPIRKSCLSV